MSESQSITLCGTLYLRHSVLLSLSELGLDGTVGYISIFSRASTHLQCVSVVRLGNQRNTLKRKGKKTLA